MIKVNVSYTDADIKKIVIKGHADSDEKGKDLVCAEVSAIGVGTLNAIDSICPESCLLTMKEGYIEIEVKSNSKELQILLNMIRIQLKSVEYANHDYIKVMKEEV